MTSEDYKFMETRLKRMRSDIKEHYYSIHSGYNRMPDYELGQINGITIVLELICPNPHED